MDIDNPRIAYDEDYSKNPLCFFTFAANENGIAALKLLLE